MLESITRITKPLTQITSKWARQPVRTTYILKRRFPPLMPRMDAKIPRNPRRLDYVYDLVKDDAFERKEIDVILLKPVDGIGLEGDILTLGSTKAYNKLLLPGLAVYATEENKVKYEHLKALKTYSSPHAQAALSRLSSFVLYLVMSKANPWTIEPWHIRVAFRKSSIWVPDYAITMPEKKITGPDMNLENKEFIIKVTINKVDTVNVRCRIHHWSKNPEERPPKDPFFYLKRVEPVFPEDKALLDSMPEPRIPKSKAEKFEYLSESIYTEELDEEDQ